MTNLGSVSVIVPIYNEEKTIEEIISRVAKALEKVESEIIAVNSGSTDSSFEILSQLKDKFSLKIINLENNNGKGHAVKQGLRLASKDIIIIQDADLEYNPEEYLTLLEPFTLQPHSVFVLGSRHLGAGSWRIRTNKNFNLKLEFVNLGSQFLNTLFCFLFKVKITDSQTMFKVFRKKHIQIEKLKCNQFDLDWEILGQLVLTGLQPIEVPVSYYPRTFSQGKKIRIMRDGFQALYTIFKVFTENKFLMIKPRIKNVFSFGKR